MTSVEVIGDKKCSLPQLPFALSKQPSVLQTKDNEILVCGGDGDNIKQCSVLKEQKWIKHSELYKARFYGSGVTMPLPTGVYLFGGWADPTTSVFLPNGSTTWQTGPNIPDGGLKQGCSVKISDFEIMLIGGFTTEKRVIKFNSKTHKWTPMGELQEGRFGHACIATNAKVIITGGKNSDFQYLNSTEIISLNNPTNSRTVGHLNEARAFHGLAVSHVNNQPTTIAFGGSNLVKGSDGWVYTFRDSVEIWNPDLETWTLDTDIKLDEKKDEFGFLSVPSHLLCH